MPNRQGSLTAQDKNICSTLVKLSKPNTFDIHTILTYYYNILLKTIALRIGKLSNVCVDEHHGSYFVL